MTLRVAVADDEPLPRERLVRLLGEAGCEVLAAFEDGPSMLAWLKGGQEVEALFLDIRMPGLSGLELLAELEEALPVVLVTAHPEYSLAAFEHAAFDYLLKPVTTDRLAKTLTRLERRDRSLPASPSRRAPANPPPLRFPVRAGEGMVFLELRRVSHFELIDEWVWAWSQGERYRTSWTSLADVEEVLADGTLCRIQRHLLLRLGTVTGLRPLWGRRAMVTVQGGLELEVSRVMAPKLKERLGA
jgi:two-component system LytT family response regulator/two-component system response regulator AlgR